MWLKDFLWGLWNGITSWIILIVHVFGAWNRFPVFDVERTSTWYAFGFLIGVGAWSGSASQAQS